jgi:hypothetical protein
VNLFSLYTRLCELNSIWYRVQHIWAYGVCTGLIFVPPSYIYSSPFLWEDPKTDKVENEVQRSKAEVEPRCVASALRCTELSTSINVTSRLRQSTPSAATPPTETRTSLYSAHWSLKAFRIRSRTCIIAKLRDTSQLTKSSGNNRPPNLSQSQSQSQSYFTTDGLRSITSSWRQAALRLTTSNFFPTE